MPWSKTLCFAHDFVGQESGKGSAGWLLYGLQSDVHHLKALTGLNVEAGSLMCLAVC